MPRNHEERIGGVLTPKIISFRKKILKWFSAHGREFSWRKKSASTYHRIIAEVFLQRTQAGTVALFLPVFISKYPSWAALSFASETGLQEILTPIGLWRQRAASLHLLAQEMGKRKGHFPRNRKEIDLLPGVGQYIANAIYLFCFKEPQPLIDVNMARVLERFFGPRTLVDIRYDPYLQSLAKRVVSCNSPWEINWAILDLAALICKKQKPSCNQCPLNRLCQFAQGQKLNDSKFENRSTS